MEASTNSMGGYAPDFELPGIDGQVHHLGRYLDKFRAVGVVFMTNDCPTVKKYIPRLKEIQQEFFPQGFTLIGINGQSIQESIGESLEAMRVFAQEEELNFPYLRDVNQDVTQGFGVKVTPEVFVIDQQLIFRYRGAIDDSPESTAKIKNPYLKNSISALLAGETIFPYCTTPVGSNLL